MNAVIISVAILFFLLFLYLLKQSKKPTGLVGIWMMKIWNQVYFPMVEWAISQLEQRNVKNILDVGIGNGQSTLYLKQYFPNSKVIGIDISKTAITQAKKWNIADLNFELKDVGQTTYSAGSFDLITAFQTHFHWPDLSRAFSELRRILRRDGLILLACEWSKLTYFQPKLKKEEEFAAFLNNKGLKLVSSQRKNQWILYKIVKKPEGVI
ncbi:class I SAM-dependent methyltransferase [Streptococcus intermedius]